MTRYTLTILEEHRVALQSALFRDESEYGALLLCGRSTAIDPWTGDLEERFLVRQVVEVDESAFTERTPIKMTWSTTPFYRLLKQAEPKNFAVGVVHSHPAAALRFSKQDDIADSEIFEIAFNRLESRQPHVSVIMGADGQLVARAYSDDLKSHPVELVRVIGSRWRFSTAVPALRAIPTEFDRQVRAFGAAAMRELMELRIGIVGCGGTGSAVASLLARLGVRRIALFDADRVD